jgi:uncharacterized membrane protein
MQKAETLLMVIKSSLSSSSSPESFGLAQLFLGSYFMLFCGALILICLLVIFQFFQLKRLKKNSQIQKSNISINAVISLIIASLFVFLPQTT